jgi:hypothetical protein
LRVYVVVRLGFDDPYIEPLANDEFQIHQALLFELTDMGMEVVAARSRSLGELISS